MTEPMSPADSESLRGEAIAEWEDPPRGGKKGAAPVLAVDGFAAPLDWLLDRVTAQKIDLAKLSILALVEAFVCALEAALPAGSPAGPEGAPSGTVGRNGGAGAKLGQWGDWLVMAATLAWLRSKLLLPPDTREARAAAQEAEALRQKLLRRVAMGEVADWLERRPRLGHDVFLARIGAEPEDIARGADTTDLLRACLAALKLALPADSYRPPAMTLWRVSDALARFGELLPTLPPGSSISAYLPKIRPEAPDRLFFCRAAVASTLLASLELARGGALTLDQPEPWTPLQVYPSPEPAA